MSLLNDILEHQQAPRFNYRCDDQLSEEGLEQVRRFEAELAAKPVGWRPGQIPDWVQAHTERVYREVPYYRQFGSYSGDFESLPLVNRAALVERPELFVPDSMELDEMIVYWTSGTTASSALIPSHPAVSSQVLPLLNLALQTRGTNLPRGSGQVALALVSFQENTLTYATTSSFLDGAVFVKLNLNPADWPRAQAREVFLRDLNPAVISGDPISLKALASLDPGLTPRALACSAMALGPVLANQLEEQFGCPVLDLYSLTEARMIAVATAPGHQLLSPDLFLEVLDPSGRRCRPGQRGEIVVTVTRNPYQPLIRYRTGDFASSQWIGEQPVLVGLEGRQPVTFRGRDGSQVNNIDVTRALRDFPLTQLQLHQNRDETLLLRFRGKVKQSQLEEALASLLGQPVECQLLEGPLGPKLLTYTSDLLE